MSVIALEAKIVYRDRLLAAVIDICLGKGNGDLYLESVRKADEEFDKQFG